MAVLSTAPAVSSIAGTLAPALPDVWREASRCNTSAATFCRAIIPSWWNILIEEIGFSRQEYTLLTDSSVKLPGSVRLSVELVGRRCNRKIVERPEFLATHGHLL